MASQSPEAVLAMKKHLDKIQDRFSQSEKQLSDLTKQVEEIRNSLKNKSESENRIQESVAALSTQLSDLTKKLTVKKKKKPKKIVKKPIDYQVSAIIPGRAWIINPDGITSSVAVGERIKGYGKVTAVVPSTGQVYTSSGLVLSYGQHDY